MDRSIVLVGLVALAAAVVSAEAGAEGSFDRTLQVTGPAELDIRTGSGRIEVRSGPAGSVRIHGSIRVGRDWFGSAGSAEEQVRRLESNPPIEQDGAVIRIGHRDREEWQRRVQISYEIAAPPGSRVRADSGSGSLIIEGLAGPVDAHTGSGSITITGPQGEVRATTGSGRVAVSGHKGLLRARTGSGRITAEGEPAGDWNLHTGSGSVSLRVPAASSFDLRARTGSGRISVDHPLTVRGSIGRRAISGRVGQGGPALDISTGSGSIRVE